MGREPVAAMGEIKLTADMITAGCEELALCESYDPPWEIVSAIYCAMENARRASS